MFIVKGADIVGGARTVGGPLTTAKYHYVHAADSLRTFTVGCLTDAAVA